MTAYFIGVFIHSYKYANKAVGPFWLQLTNLYEHGIFSQENNSTGHLSKCQI